ncbi:undecaprenyl-diphosphatase UppP [Pelodictyon phaeoclathratiforme]|jgi:undecaprenyl-diphosphatase|uniref:Undecaprenyl-diphosphatase n=1 Tax=Pelodictyon phaeoclathratiforme (strain DSM 5477 / BU-1) TaxID=324925 RepID=UPPP_PELPB|nr:undecaprenyl-diphosphatase UppP [Pelodictyon phaeoclathratiforme]B4SDS7.1 RecName: Full=Undecaprenyl-diphosphatase; AltName: Full=Bacitracin resistance protein; AltName: Full=Undecaprenyl pyrophosphate phosphatase [Pelodictyon phaeoclathratiforme BU-1]ACF44445.1 undecaprenol kinase [Pelodictyon phaeoclathratiforme BU-1]MBV5290467.1 undecaprenyl-diphosphatase UppP [Pelodictyon phaeoclathratiforme]
MTLFEAIVLGIVQGLTEFLPISSTAHLRIIPALAGWEDPGAAFTAIVQIGTLVAVLLYFWKDIFIIVAAVIEGIVQRKPLENSDAKMGWMIVAGTIPIVIFGKLFETQIDTTLRSLYWISGSLIGLAIILFLAEGKIKNRIKKELPLKAMENIGWKEALLIGLAQSIALIPGSSRSGVTITGGLFLNLDRATAARFSFLLSLPAVFAAGLYKLYQTWDIIVASPEHITNILVATLVAGIVGYASIAFLLNYLKKHTTTIFIAYRLVAGTAILYLVATGVLQP